MNSVASVICTVRAGRIGNVQLMFFPSSLNQANSMRINGWDVSVFYHFALQVHVCHQKVPSDTEAPVLSATWLRFNRRNMLSGWKVWQDCKAFPIDKRTSLWTCRGCAENKRREEDGVRWDNCTPVGSGGLITSSIFMICYFIVNLSSLWLPF